MDSETNDLLQLSLKKTKEYLKLLELKFKEVDFTDVKRDELSEVNKIRYDLFNFNETYDSLELQVESIENDLINTKDTKKKKELNLAKSKVNKDLKYIEEQIKLSKTLLSNYYIKTHLEDFINIYLCESDSSEVFIVKNLLNNSYQKCTKQKLIDLMKIICMRYKYVAKMPGYYFAMKPQDFLDYCFRNNLIRETFDIGFKPTRNEKELQGNFYFEDKKLLNCYVPGVYESKASKYVKLENHDNLTNEQIYEQFKFPLIDKLLKHLIGDNRVFYEETIKLLSTNKYNSTALRELQMIVTTLNLKLTTESVEEQKKEVIKYCETQLLGLNTNEDYKETTLKAINYFYSWLAFIYQNPTFKIPNGIGFKTTQGAGKDIFISWVLSPIWGAHNIRSVGQTDLNEKFNGYIKGARFVICNELEYRRENTQMYESLKRLMTNPSLTLREMHKTQYNIPNYSHFLFFGNHDNMLRVEKGDRRLTINEQNLICPKLIPFKLSPNLINEKGELLNKGVLEKELNQFSRFLWNLKVSFEDIERPLHTEIKQEIQEYHKTDIELFIEKFKDFESFEKMLIYYIPYDEVMKNQISKLEEFLGNSQLLTEGLISNEILFKLFKCVCKAEGFNSRRSQRSFGKALSILNIRGPEETYHCNILGKTCKTKYITDLITDKPKTKTINSGNIEIDFEDLS